MAAWLKLTLAPDGPMVIVNADSIAIIRPAAKSEGAVIEFVGRNDILSIWESSEMILERIVAAGGKKG